MTYANRLLIGFILFCVLANQNSFGQNAYAFESDILKIEKLSNSVFRHISFVKTDDFGKVACNGMIYINENEAIVCDTPVNNEASLELIKWITKQGKSLKAVIITHFHNDCLGGLKQFHNLGITSYAHEKTIDLAKKEDYEIPKNAFKTKLELTVGLKKAMATYFGEGHTIDNTVVYIADEQVLFGGCLIKCLGAGKGYLGDANTSAWPFTVKKIKAEYPKLKLVIPGHGKSGDITLLDYTVTLFKS